MKKTKLLTKILCCLGGFVVSFGIISSVFASTYDDESNIIIADGNGMDETNGNNFVSDPDTAVIVSGTLTNIRATLVALYDYIADPSSHSGGVSALKTKLANIQSLKLDIQGDAEITPNDLGYITFLTNYVGNDSAQVDVNVTGNVTFGSGTNDYIDDEIADVKTSNFTLSADKTITLPYGSDIESFFGDAKIEENNEIIVDGISYIVDNNGNPKINFVEETSRATIGLTGLNDTYTLPLIGSLVVDFTGSITNFESVSNLIGVTSVKVTSDTNLNGIKFWNAAFPDDELLGGDGEYLGDSQSQAFPIGSAPDTGFKLEFTQPGTYEYEFGIVSVDNTDIYLSEKKTGSILVKKLELATLDISGLDFPKTLASPDGIVEDEFIVSITGTGEVENEEVFSKVVIIGGDLTKVKLYNIAFSDDELLQGDGEYLGSSDSEKFQVTTTGATFKIEIGAAGIYNYEISLVYANDTNALVSEKNIGSIVINPYEAPYYSGGGGGGGGSSIQKDNCPNGDYSSSYYDGICGDEISTGGIITTQTATADDSYYTLTHENKQIVDTNTIGFFGLNNIMVENLKSELKNGKEIINSVEVIKIENEIAIKLKVFNVLYEPQGAIIETTIDNMYKGKLNTNNLQNVIYARNKAMLVIKKILVTYTQEEKQKLVDELKNNLTEFVISINTK